MSLLVATEGVPTTEDLPFCVSAAPRRFAMLASHRDGPTIGEVER